MSFIKSKLQTAINNNMKNTFKTLLFISLLCGVSGADETKSVMEGDSVTLQTEEKILTYNQIMWRFGGALIAEITDEGEIRLHEDVADGRFTGRLKLDNQTGSLTITNTRTIHTGDYKIQIETNTGTTEKRFTLTVYDSPPGIDPDTTELKSVSVIVGESVTLNTDINPHGDELIVWRFGDILIAKVDKENNKTSLYPDGRFKDRIHLDQTGSLIITDSRTAHTGEYKLKISSNRETKLKIFILTVNHPPMSAAAKAGITLAVLVAFLLMGAAGVIYHRRRISEQERLNDDWRTVSVMMEKSVPLITDDDHIKRFKLNVYHGDTVIAEIRRGEITPVTDEFSERLKLDQTGSLIISNSRCSDSGIYKLKTINRTGEEITYKRIIVHVSDEGIRKMVQKGNSVYLSSDVTELQKDAEVEWKFENTVIADKKQKDKKISIRQDAHDEFKQNLKVNEQTGSLTIIKSTMDHSGVYELKINSSRATVHKIIRVSVIDTYRKVRDSDEVNESDSLNNDAADDEVKESDGLMNNAADDEVNKKQVTSPV